MKTGRRLARCMERGNLTVADLARWLGRPHATVRTWLAGREPGGPCRDQQALAVRLARLEILIRGKHGFPVPRMSPAARIAYLRKLV